MPESITCAGKDLLNTNDQKNKLFKATSKPCVSIKEMLLEALHNNSKKASRHNKMLKFNI